MKKVAIIVARQGSTRMPGKSMSLIMGKPVTWHIVERLKRMGLFDEICIATSHLEIDRPLIDLAKEMNISSYGGHPEDVLDRLYHAAKQCKADVVVEIGGDCPLVDRDITLKALTLLEKEQADFVTNVEVQTFPDGLDIYALKFSALEKAHKEAQLSSQRNHPFSYIHKNPEIFKVVNFTHEKNLSHIRLTLDYVEDFQLISKIFETLYTEKGLFSFQDVMKLLTEKSDLLNINQNRNLPHTESAVPAYWYTKAYIKDMMNDVVTLMQKSFEDEKNDNFKELEINYKNIKSAVDELNERAKFFSKKN